jgi:hypothetical protein
LIKCNVRRSGKSARQANAIEAASMNKQEVLSLVVLSGASSPRDCGSSNGQQAWEKESVVWSKYVITSGICMLEFVFHMGPSNVMFYGLSQVNRDYFTSCNSPSGGRLVGITKGATTMGIESFRGGDSGFELSDCGSL